MKNTQKDESAITISRRIGINICKWMKSIEMNPEDLAKRLNYSSRDMYRILEGRLILSPSEMKKIAKFFSKTRHDLFYLELNNPIPKLRFMKKFSDIHNLDKILDLIDQYVYLKESV